VDPKETDALLTDLIKNGVESAAVIGNVIKSTGFKIIINK